MSIGDLYKTGQISPTNANYNWVKYTDGTTSPQPTAEEKVIPLDKGDEFPPIKSCNKGAWWKMKSYR